MTTPRPICVHCGKPYGQRKTTNEIVIWPSPKKEPPYKGNGIVISQWGHDHPQSGDGTVMGLPFKAGDMIRHRHVWDGESWSTPYEPFCTLRCALDYARIAYRKSAS